MKKNGVPVARKRIPEETAEPVKKRLSAELLTVKGIHDRRVARAEEAFRGPEKDAQRELESLNEKVRGALRALQDHVDDEHLRTGRDPGKVERSVRYPADVLRHRGLLRAWEDAREKQLKTVEELETRLKASPEGLRLREAREARDRWIGDVCAHYGCWPPDIDWNKGEVSCSATETLPETLVSIPAEA